MANDLLKVVYGCVLKLLKNVQRMVERLKKKTPQQTSFRMHTNTDTVTEKHSRMKLDIIYTGRN